MERGKGRKWGKGGEGKGKGRGWLEGGKAGRSTEEEGGGSEQESQEEVRGGVKGHRASFHHLT